MRAWQITGVGEPADVLGLAQVEPPPVPAGHVRCAVEAAALGLPDVLMCRGVYAFQPPLPFTPGQEFVGIVAEVASDVTEWAIGDRVAGVASFYTGNGTFADTTMAPAHTLYPVPAAMGHGAAGFCIAFHTAHAALEVRAKLQPDETLVVHGAAGGTGTAACQVGRALGARVVAVVGGTEKATWVAPWADVVIDHRSSDFVDDVLAATDGRGADVIFDPVGGKVYERSFRCLATGGRILPIGLASGGWGRTPLGHLALKNVSIVTASPTGYDRPTALAHHQHQIDRFTRGEIAPVVGREVGFAGIAEALTELAERGTLGKTIAVL